MVQQRIVQAPTALPGVMAPAFSTLDTSVWNDHVHGSIDQIRGEIRDSHQHATTFVHLNPDEAMALAGGYSARMSELAARIREIEGDVPGWRSVRDAAEACREEMRWQHEVHSRLHTTREFDWKVETGER